MQFGISGKPVPADLPYAGFFNRVCTNLNFPPIFAYAIGWRESIQGEVNGKWTALTVVSGDGGHGIMQLTSSYPDNWNDAASNITYGVEHFLKPAVAYWHGNCHYAGSDLVRLSSATFNAGLGNAKAGHRHGNVDAFTTGNYAAGVLAIYTNIVNTGKPNG